MEMSAHQGQAAGEKAELIGKRLKRAQGEDGREEKWKASKKRRTDWSDRGKRGGRKPEGGEISAVEGERDVGLIIRIRNVDGRG